MAGRNPRQPPLHWVKKGNWPEGTLREDAPPSAALIQGIALRLKEALHFASKNNAGRVTAREAAEASGVGATTISNIIRGTTSPDAETVARLEAAFDIDLWGKEHRPKTDSNDDDDPTGGNELTSEDGKTAGYTENGEPDDSAEDDEDEADDEQPGYSEYGDADDFPDGEIGADGENWQADLEGEGFGDSEDWLAR